MLVRVQTHGAFKIGTLPEGFKDIASELRGIAGIRV